MGWFSGKKPKYKQLSLLGQEQQPLYQQLLGAGSGMGAGGAFGEAADYYRSLLEPDNETYNMMAAPEYRKFQQETIPGLAEQFAGMGSGGLSSSGFRNASIMAGTDLAERLGAIRAQLRQSGAAGLMGIGQQGLGRFHENIYQPGTPGMASKLGPGLGAGLGMALGGPLGAAFGAGAGGMLSSQQPQLPTPYQPSNF